MKPIVLLIAIYSLIIHQANKDHAIKSTNKRVHNSTRFSYNPSRLDGRNHINKASYKNGLITIPALLSTNSFNNDVPSANQLIWPGEMKNKYEPIQAYYPFQ